MAKVDKEKAQTSKTKDGAVCEFDWSSYARE